MCVFPCSIYDFPNFMLCFKVVVWEVPDIKKGFLAESQVPGEEGLYRLKTEGVNMQV